jgi:creatinine amidohydrolase/Fe(II)-dependent formamide hydrolase-like protein/7-cyano-7-deazaguanine synthase in queuosine biosynthesis
MNPSTRPKTPDPLSSLEVFDRLEVGPVRVEPRRLTAPYRVVRGGNEERTELVYRYEEDVFDPEEAESLNLASLIAAQVALNYGLFARKLVFHGSFDEADRRFLRTMAENTAREIYVMKFLQPNPFLVGEPARLPTVRRKSYLRAELEFPGGSPAGSEWRYWSGSPDRHAVLSSGGKDSLLSFALLEELGQDVHPVFVNESGRHWFTALNAYRHFRENVPRTARVWVNSDRVFAWMLRHMPFVRRDFADVRSDEYPIRLWTVAVFLFGALPLLRKRGIGSLLIGDEHDSTHRTTTRGIPHYDGLYDQSRYFDRAFSRYSLSKGWGVRQFSVLRPLGEMLILKILVERYPELQALQTSCHATHEEAGRIRPCGRCEKCRRIVGMLVALGADPGRCGYDGESVRICLEDLVEKGIHQEAPGVKHLMHGLARRGSIQLPAAKKALAREHPEVLKLRFDPERSPVEAIPSALRGPLYRIFLEHADGAVRREGRRWVTFDVLADPSLERPYPFETVPGRTHRGRGSGRRSARDHIWGELTRPEAEERLERVDVALLPVGSIEQHGPHLPLDTDAFDAEYLAHRVAEACSEPRPLVLPLIPYGVSYHHDDFRGTLSVDNDTLSRLVYDVGRSAARNGIRKLVIINGHGGNSPALNHAAQMINRDDRIFVCVDSGETSDVDIYKMVETQNDVHAGEIETSTALAVRPHLVRMDLVTGRAPRFSSRYLNFTSKRGVSWYAYTKKVSPSGVMGNPSRASAEKGRKMWQIMIAHLTALVEDLKSMTLDEIYQKKY